MKEKLSSTDLSEISYRIQSIKKEEDILYI